MKIRTQYKIQTHYFFNVHFSFITKFQEFQALVDLRTLYPEQIL